MAKNGICTNCHKVYNWSGGYKLADVKCPYCFIPLSKHSIRKYEPVLNIKPFPDITIDGSDIDGIRVIDSMYNGQSVTVGIADDTGNHYRLHENQIASMANEFVFKASKSRKYHYLEIDWEKTKELWKREGHI